jgi:hypothetical protein
VTPAALLQAAAMRLRARRALAQGGVAAALGAALAALAALLEKAGLPAPLGPLEVTFFALLLASALAARALFRGPGLPEAAYAVDAAAGGEERFATLLDLAAREGDPFRAPIARACAAIARRTSPSSVVPVQPPRALAPLLGAAVLLALAAALSPRAGEAERRLRAEQAGRLRAVAGALGTSPGADVGAARERLAALAAALESGRLDPGDLLRALEEARRGLARARLQEALPDIAERLAAEAPALERLAAALAPGAAPEEAPRSAAGLALEPDPAKRDASSAALERLAALAESEAARALAGASARAEGTAAALAGTALLAEAGTAGDRRAALAAAAACLEAAIRRLEQDPGAGPGLAARPARASAGAPSGAAGDAGAPPPPAGPSVGTDLARTSAPEAAGAAAPARGERRDPLPPRLEEAVARYFSEESPR